MRQIKFRLALVIFVTMIAVQFLVAAPTGQRLRALANPSGFLIGSITRSSFQTVDSGAYARVLNEEFNFVTCENAMKMDALQPSQNSFNFGEADQTVAYAQANGMKVHGHTLVWHSQSPGWVQNIRDRNALISAMNNHIDQVLAHYKGKILVWDVVNEAFNEDGTYRNSFWYQVIGQSYIDLAFQRARQADPATKLIYNDYNIEALGAKSNGAYNMIKSMVERGIPIDGVGFQMHLTDGGLNYQSFADNMARFAALGLEIYITEMDVRMPDSNRDLQKQATIYREVLRRCVAQPACKAVQVWGIPDKYSWCMSTFPGTGVPLIFDDNYNAKPAYYAVQEVLATLTNPTTSPTVTPTPTPTPTQTMLITPTPQQNPVFSGGPYTLNGSSDYVDLPDGLTDNLSDFSVACWVKLDSLTNWVRIFDFGGDSNVFMMLTPASATTGYPYFAITTTGNDGEQGLNGTSALPAGSWQHLAVVKSGNTGILYINKQEVARNTGMSLRPADLGHTVNNYIGRSQWSHDPYLHGSVDKFVFYNRAISAAEVTTLGNIPPGETGMTGDVNGDGSVTIIDAMLIAQYASGLNPAGFNSTNADVNCDGSININDALLVARYAAGLSTTFPCN